MYKIIKRKHLAEQLGICSAKLSKLVETENFPRPIKIGDISGWLEHEVKTWIDERIAERDSAVAGSDL